jgi:hypothetical protein
MPLREVFTSLILCCPTRRGLDYGLCIGLSPLYLGPIAELTRCYFRVAPLATPGRLYRIHLGPCLYEIMIAFHAELAPLPR